MLLDQELATLGRYIRESKGRFPCARPTTANTDNHGISENIVAKSSHHFILFYCHQFSPPGDKRNRDCKQSSGFFLKKYLLKFTRFGGKKFVKLSYFGHYGLSSCHHNIGGMQKISTSLFKL
jgi:hypothetical protein